MIDICTQALLDSGEDQTAEGAQTIAAARVEVSAAGGAAAGAAGGHGPRAAPLSAGRAPGRLQMICYIVFGAV